MMNEGQLKEWLLENGGSVIKYRTAKELIGSKNIDFEQYVSALVNEPQIEKFFNLFSNYSSNLTMNYNSWHGAKKELLENVLGKLLEMGICKDIKAFDEKIQLFREWISQKHPQYPDYVMITSLFMAWCFLRGGYQHSELLEFVIKRITSLHISAKKQIFDFYRKDNELKGIPKKFAHQCIKQELDPYGGDMLLPLIHDIYSLAYLPEYLQSDEIKRKISDIVNYILDERFQIIPEKYGYIVWDKQCYSCGWSPKLPGFTGFKFSGIEEDMFFMRFELMSHFKEAHKSKWFQNCLEYLEQYRTSEGTYILPACYLKEKPTGYYVHGAYMGLEDMRTKKAIEIESTFRMVSLKNRIRNDE